MKSRLVTRSDFDGLVCAVLLKEMNLIDDIKFVHPKDVQDGLVEINENDILTNLPYVNNAKLVFDHHFSELLRLENKQNPNHIIDPIAPSAARVVYNYFGGTDRFPRAWDELMAAVDKANTAQFSVDEILQPEKWVLLNYLMDPRTGLGRFREFRISNYALMMALIDYCKNHTIEEILEIPDVKERSEYAEYTGICVFASTKLSTLSPACASPLIPCSGAKSAESRYFSAKTSAVCRKLLSTPVGFVISAFFLPVKILSSSSFRSTPCKYAIFAPPFLCVYYTPKF